MLTAARPCLRSVALQRAETLAASSSTRGIATRSAWFYSDDKDKEQASTEPPSESSSTESDSGEASAEGGESAVTIESLLDEVKEWEDKFLRSQAEIYNTRQRMEKELQKEREYGLSSVMKNMLPVVDNFERALDAVPAEQRDSETTDNEGVTTLYTGVRMIHNQLIKILEDEQVTSYWPEGEPFDPNIHHAMFEVPDPNSEPGICAVVTTRGYKLRDRVLRPAQVGVTKKP